MKIRCLHFNINFPSQLPTSHSISVEPMTGKYWTPTYVLLLMKRSRSEKETGGGGCGQN